ncbi:GNAT family N-acetyltransferase [Kutzneria buriramensis]|uniref:Acetyltransferase (GNAT) family protein n=1 Tax=Kutzneria buriramensis TaxID=1045776 RepID=A0A3E0I9Z4_9PSEU|nr:GNAT family N-acetyltransferase [Kutzneria buriramensis]REH55459.1 acetyltransferase (GNAT) family protein [Kutzneria buriramensis]
MDIDVERLHAARLALLDPLLPADPPLTGDVIDTVGALGASTFREIDPESIDASWGPLRRHTLAVRLAGADLAPLLDRWEEHLAKVVTPGDVDCAAQISWPSRDTAAVRTLIEHGFGPLAVLAVRRAGVFGEAPKARNVSVRHATKADLVACVALSMEVIRYDTQFGLLTERPSTEAEVRRTTAELLDRDQPCVWLAEVDGRAAGIVTVDLPPHSEWIAGRTSAGPAAYLGLGGVRADLRGGGVGSALVAQVHRELDDAGIEATLLHYAVPNPRSVPFWSIQGYRPLWTGWSRRPALRA